MNIEKILMWTATIFIVISIAVMAVMAVMADIIVTQQAEIYSLQKKCR